MEAKQKEALQGVRVLDFTWIVTGATATRILASFGAEIIRVEWPDKPDLMRFSMYPKGAEPGLDNGAFFNNLNAGKRGVTLNAKSERGIKLIHELIKKCDIVTENFSATVLERWGLTYEAMKEINPRIIYMSLSGMGHSGRNKTYTTWGPTAQALNGMTYTSGLPNEHTAGWGYSYMDVMAGYTGAYAVLAALYHQKRTGKGQYIDISQVETGLAFTGANLLDFTVNNRSSRRPGFPAGNRSISSYETPENSYRGREGAPHNSYQCLGGGKNDWCTIAVFSDEEWERLKMAMGSPEWCENAKYSNAEGRIRYQDELDAHLGNYSIKFNKHDLMYHLQSNGVACAAVQTSEDLVEIDPQLKGRGVYTKLDHSVLGERRFEEIPINMSETPPYLHHSAPLMGADNEYVFGEILGYSQAEIAQWANEDVLWPKDMPRESMKIRQPLW